MSRLFEHYKFSFSNVDLSKVIRSVVACLVIAATNLPGAASAATFKVQPIQVCDDAGKNCASVNTFSSYFSKIYAQTGDTIDFLPIKKLNSTAYLNLETIAEAEQLIASTTGTQRTDDAYDMWFVSSMTAGYHGLGALGGDGVVVTDDIITINRVDTPAHELGHNLGFNHSSSTQTDARRFLMAKGAIREIPTTLSDVVPDGRQLSRFEPILPEITVDTVGSTPFQNDSFFNVTYLTGVAPDIFLKEITVNLATANAFTDPTNTPPGESSSPFGLSKLNGISTADISVSGIADGSQSFTLTIADGAFAPGESFSFGVDIDLLSNIDGFGATPDELRTVFITFSFSNGHSITQSLADQVASSVFDPLANIDRPALLFADPDSSQVTGVPGTTIPALDSWAEWVLLLSLFGTGIFVLRKKFVA